MIRDSFLFYRSFYDAIKELPREIRGEVLTAIMEYGLDGVTTEDLKPVAKAMFTLIKPQLDANNRKYENGKTPKNRKNTVQNGSNNEAPPKQPESNNEANGKLMDNVECRMKNENEEGEKGAPPQFENSMDRPPSAPSLQQVEECFFRLGNSKMEAKSFFDYYEGLNWKKGISTIVNWQSFANRWVAGEKKQGSDAKSTYTQSDKDKWY